MSGLTCVEELDVCYKLGSANLGSNGKASLKSLLVLGRLHILSFAFSSLSDFSVDWFTKAESGTT